MCDYLGNWSIPKNKLKKREKIRGARRTLKIVVWITRISGTVLISVLVSLEPVKHFSYSLMRRNLSPMNLRLLGRGELLKYFTPCFYVNKIKCYLSPPKIPQKIHSKIKMNFFYRTNVGTLISFGAGTDADGLNNLTFTFQPISPFLLQ